MFVESHNNLRDLQITECTRAVVYDQHHNPLVIVLTVGEQIMVVRRDDDEFERVAMNLGINPGRLESFTPKPLDRISIK